MGQAMQQSCGSIVRQLSSTASLLKGLSAIPDGPVGLQSGSDGVSPVQRTRSFDSPSRPELTILGARTVQ